MVIFPIIATLVALGCAGAVGRDYLRRPKPDRVAWMVAFVMFAAAAAAQVIGSLAHWTPLLARAYYVLGATLVVGYLALGELYLILPARRAWVDRVAGALVALSAFGAALVWRAPVAPDVATRGWEALQRGAALTTLTIGINALGTLTLLGGLLYSAWRFKRLGIMRNRTLGCVLIAAGTLAVALGGTLTRLGSDQYLYIAMAVGTALIFAGYLKATQPDAERAVAPVAAPMPAAATPAARPTASVPTVSAPPAAVPPVAQAIAASVTATFVRVTPDGAVAVPAEAARRLGLRSGDLTAIVETADGLLVVARDTFVTTMLDRISADLAEAEPAADPSAVSMLRERRSS